MDIVLLKTFLEVSKTRHFGKAADRLFITQSAVSARVKLLESTLGFELFDRRRNDIQLTVAGQRLYRHAEMIVNGWERARHELMLQAGMKDSLAIGCTYDLWAIVMRRLALQAGERHPELALSVEVHSTDTLMQRLNSGLLDMVLVFEPPVVPGLLMRQVASIPLLLVSSKADVSLGDAMGRNYIYVDWGVSFGLSHSRHFPDIPSPAMRTGQGSLALDLLLGRGGSAYLAEQMALSSLESGKLFKVANAPIIQRYAYAVFRTDAEEKSGLKKMLELAEG